MYVICNLSCFLKLLYIFEEEERKKRICHVLIIILFNLTSSDVCNSKNRTSSYISIQRMSKTHFLNVKSNYFSSFFSMGLPNTRLTVEYNSTFLEKSFSSYTLRKSNSKQPIKSQQELGKILTTQVKKKIIILISM